MKRGDFIKTDVKPKLMQRSVLRIQKALRTGMFLGLPLICGMKEEKEEEEEEKEKEEKEGAGG